MIADLFDAGDALAMLDDFGELLEYLPRVGEPRVIVAYVKRQFGEPTGAGQQRRSVDEYLLIGVANDATRGISSAEIDLGGDHVKASLRIGAPPRKLSLSKPSDSRQWNDPAMVWIEAR